MKFLIAFLGAVAVALSASVPLEGNDVSSQRYIVLWDSKGVPQVVDTEAPLPEVFVSSSDISLHLYTRNNPSSPVSFSLDASSVVSSSTFSRSRRNIFIIHGWQNSKDSDVNTLVRQAYLSVLDVNVFVVDWSSIAGTLLYPAAAGSVIQIGNLLGSFIGDMQSRAGQSASSFMLVGHSLGAHIAGCTGAALNGNVAVIVGLDPAGPLFSTGNTANRLDPTDGQFVHVIHTNTNLLGFSASCGHADIRPNGGGRQPGCGIDATGSCSHGRAYQFLAESITSGGFTSWRCDSYSSFTSGSCSSAATTRLGGSSIDTSASGDYYLTTNSASPFSQG